ncbi:MAG TPA: hypothetical protein VJ647_00415 [Chitinophagaceae bacterium]|nr:hypothetical protein [Chitinophagaceae bacterium]
MKTLLQPTTLFTGRKLLYTALIAGTVSFASCNSKQDDTPSEVSEDDVTEVVTQAVATNSGGLSVQMQGTVAVSTNLTYLTLCGTSKDTSVSGTGSIGNNISWDYDFNWHWMLACNSGIPSRFDLTFRGLIEYSGPVINSLDSSIATYTVTNLNNSQLSVDVTYNRYGTKQFKNGRQLSFNSLITLTASDVVVDKITQKIVSGTADIEIVGTDNRFKSFTYSGTLTFTGNNTGILTFASGHTVNISW